MVVHDRTQIEQWSLNKAAQEQTKYKKKMQINRRSTWTVVAIQSLACVVLLLLTFLFRLVGGNAYEGLRQGFHQALEKNELVTVISRLWDKDPFDAPEGTDENAVKHKSFTG